MSSDFSLRSPENQPIRRWDRSLRQPTVSDLLALCAKRGLDPDKVRLTGGEISWEETETDVERDKRLAHWAAVDRAREARANGPQYAMTIIPATEDAWPGTTTR